MKRPRHARPTVVEFEEHLHDLAPLEAKSPGVQWFIAECSRARDSEDALKKVLAAFPFSGAQAWQSERALHPGTAPGRTRAPGRR